MATSKTESLAACTHCQAAKGVACVTPRGVVRAPHAVRIDDADLAAFTKRRMKPCECCGNPCHGIRFCATCSSHCRFESDAANRAANCPRRRERRMPQLTRTDDEIGDVQNEVAATMDEGGSRFPGMSYEEGVHATLLWLFDRGDHPYPEA